MSAEPALRAPRAVPRPSASPAGSPATEPRQRPRLRVVRPPAQARTHVPFVIVCMAILAAALLAALLLNTQLAQGAYAKQDMDSRLAELARTEQQLSAQLDTNRAPAELAARAAALGMQPAGATGWLSLADGTVRGGTEADG
ncbi:MAG TPA: hypothetical protein VGC57_16825 [Cellulomonas sp.]